MDIQRSMCMRVVISIQTLCADALYIGKLKIKNSDYGAIVKCQLLDFLDIVYKLETNEYARVKFNGRDS